MEDNKYPWSDFVEDDKFDPNEYLINYNEKYKDAEPVLFRENVLKQIISCLIGNTKPNALLVGAAGVGKTRLVEELARLLANKAPIIPRALAGYTVYELPLSNIVSGSGLVGDVERKTKNILKFAQDPKNKAILFIDEIHMLVSDNNTYDKIAQMLKPALARGETRVVGATTLQESQNLMDDPAFNRRFTRLIVDEISPKQTLELLMKMKESMYEFYEKRVVIDDQTLKDIVDIADEYRAAGSHRPDNAITLLDRVMADSLIELYSDVIKGVCPEEVIKAGFVIPSRAKIKLTALRLLTGNNEREELDVPRLKRAFHVIKGQDDIVEYIVDTVKRDSLGLFPRVKPLTMLFAGMSGVGKTEIAKILAKELTDTQPIVLNMTEYNSEASINRIIGSPAGYVGSDSKAELPFDCLESNPYQIILLDEFEKGDRSVQRLFMSAFDEGYIKTSKGKVVDFSKSIIIATTNAGCTDRSDTVGFISSGKAGLDLSVSDLAAYMDVELLNRFTKVLVFNPISEEIYRDIVSDQYERYVRQIKAAKPEYDYLPEVLDICTLDRLVEGSYERRFGARPAAKTVQSHIEELVLNH